MIIPASLRCSRWRAIERLSLDGDWGLAKAVKGCGAPLSSAPWLCALAHSLAGLPGGWGELCSRARRGRSPQEGGALVSSGRGFPQRNNSSSLNFNFGARKIAIRQSDRVSKCDQTGGYWGRSGRCIATNRAAYYDQLGRQRNTTKRAEVLTRRCGVVNRLERREIGGIGGRFGGVVRVRAIGLALEMRLNGRAEYMKSPMSGT